MGPASQSFDGNKVGLIVLVVVEARKAQHSGAVGRRRICAHFLGERFLKLLRLVGRESLRFPDDLPLSGRTAEPVVRLRQVFPVQKSLDRLRAVLIEIKIEMSYGLYIVLGSSLRVPPQGIHGKVNFVVLRVLVSEPGLEFRRRNLLGGA